MYDIAYVYTSSELESALKGSYDYIVIQDSGLASNISIITGASKAAIAAAIAAAGVAASNFWNPVGWGVGIVGSAVGSKLTIAVVVLIWALGVTLIYAIANDYRVKGKGRIVLPDGTEVDGELILEPR
ncbi:hypothetical protein [Ferrimonas gelatinilytica]|uniref:Uncharacterized protein n=1 Tax=Ferrimonas gelatinilytica TaxID=1255257 RepID=A0ABP9SBC8_9GAMM